MTIIYKIIMLKNQEKVWSSLNKHCQENTASNTPVTLQYNQGHPNRYKF